MTKHRIELTKAKASKKWSNKIDQLIARLPFFLRNIHQMERIL